MIANDSWDVTENKLDSEIIVQAVKTIFDFLSKMMGFPAPAPATKHMSFSCENEILSTNFHG